VGGPTAPDMVQAGKGTGQMNFNIQKGFNGKFELLMDGIEVFKSDELNDVRVFELKLRIFEARLLKEMEFKGKWQPCRVEMELFKAVIHYCNGSVVKGFTQDFFHYNDRFRLFLADKPSGEAIEVFTKELKAVFAVRDFIGNPLYKERKEYIEGEEPLGRKLEVTFVDGEVLVGSTLGYHPDGQGILVFPADSNSNNIRVFAVPSAVKKVRYL
jgi:hypothetical protein